MILVIRVKHVILAIPAIHVKPSLRTVVKQIKSWIATVIHADARYASVKYQVSVTVRNVIHVIVKSVTVRNVTQNHMNAKSVNAIRANVNARNANHVIVWNALEIRNAKKKKKEKESD